MYALLYICVCMRVCGCVCMCVFMYAGESFIREDRAEMLGSLDQAKRGC